MQKLTFRLMAILCLFFANATYGQNPYERFLPKTDDAELQALFDDPEVVWYTGRTRPKVMQNPTYPHHWLSIHADIGPPQRLFSNGAGEWPWAHPATLRAPAHNRAQAIFGEKVTSARVFQRPANIADPHFDEYGSRVNPRPVYDWQLGAGTEFVEINLTEIEGVDVCYKVHRMTMGQDNVWKFRVYRPWTSAEEYEADTSTKLVSHGRHRLIDSNHERRQAFDETAEVVKAPRIEPSVAKKLLETKPFKLCENEFAFTTDYPDQVVPQNYLGPWITNGTDQARCRNCHRDVGTDVRHFGSREWYSLLPGGGKDKHGAGVFNYYDPRRVGRVYGG